MLHRDVNPANTLINESGEPLLSDFGIAKLLEPGQGHTLTGYFVSDLPEEAERVILKALARQPEDRYSDMAAFAATRPTIVPPVTWPAPPPAQPASRPGASTPEPEPKASTPAMRGTVTVDNMVEDNARGAQAASPAGPEQPPPASAGIAPVSAGVFLRAVDGYSGAVKALAFSPDGSLLATGSGNGTVSLFSAP